MSNLQTGNTYTLKTGLKGYSQNLKAYIFRIHSPQTNLQTCLPYKIAYVRRVKERIWRYTYLGVVMTTSISEFSVSQGVNRKPIKPITITADTACGPRVICKPVGPRLTNCREWPIPVQ
jgi:hypothetical protein